MIRKKDKYLITIVNDHGARVRVTTVRATSEAQALKKVVKKLKKRRMDTALRRVRESGRAQQI